jgi:hypothetical protein
VPRLRNARRLEPPAHRSLVGHHLRHLDADPGQPESRRDRGGRRNRTIGRNRKNALHAETRPDLDHTIEVGEVDVLRDVTERKGDGVPVTLDSDDPMAHLLRIANRG